VHFEDVNLRHPERGVVIREQGVRADATRLTALLGGSGLLSLVRIAEELPLRRARHAHGILERGGLNGRKIMLRTEK